ncbi:FG-GAP repeat domain-containing protein [Cystobacter fuscus]|uniref:FG-GAP repeat domain-containing protein n=1 Tax=Cystobacter fuscus TaxID=43 RepID=UPI0037C04DC5
MLGKVSELNGRVLATGNRSFRSKLVGMLMVALCAALPTPSFAQTQLPPISAEVPRSPDCHGCLSSTTGTVTINYTWNYTPPGSVTVTGSAPDNAKVVSVYLAGVPTGQGVSINKIELSHGGWYDTIFQSFTDGTVTYPTASWPKLFPFAGQSVSGEWIATPTVIESFPSAKLFMSLVIKWQVPDDGGGTGGTPPKRMPDFNGDGKTDTAVFTPGNAWLVNLATSTPGSYVAQSWSSGAAGLWGEIPLIGDFNGDGKTDTAVFTPGSKWLVNLSTGTGFVAHDWTTSTSGMWGGQPLTGDFNGDGKTDTALFTPGNAWLVNISTGSGFVTQNWTNGSTGTWGEIPLTGDFNGDGKTDIAVFTPGNKWLVNRSTGSGFASLDWTSAASGLWGEVPLAGDFNGDGKTDTGVFTPGNKWLVNRSTGSGFASLDWTSAASGLWGEIPLVSDFNNDGKADTGVFTGANAWLVNLSNGSGFAGVDWSTGTAGTWGEIPLNAPQHLINNRVLKGSWYP